MRSDAAATVAAGFKVEQTTPSPGLVRLMLVLVMRWRHGALGPVLGRLPEDRAVIPQTGHTWLTTGGSGSDAAEQLHLHRNTVRYRVRRIEEPMGEALLRR
jgi:sugar diacid utilization regulator